MKWILSTLGLVVIFAVAINDPHIIHDGVLFLFGKVHQQAVAHHLPSYLPSPLHTAG